jgi:hypothetical protein
MNRSRFLSFILLFILGACASKMKDQMVQYREAFALGKYQDALKILDESELKKAEKSRLLWLMEKGTLALAMEQEDEAIAFLGEAIELIDALYTKKISAKAASFLVNDASDVFYGSNYERSYAHYFLARAYHSRYLKSQNKADLQSARATILAWDSFFSHLQRSTSAKTLYQTDLMLKVFGAQIHEVSEIKNDQQIALQLYKDAIQILYKQGGIFNLFNKKNSDYIKSYEKFLTDGSKLDEKLFEKSEAFQDLEDYLHYKVLSLTKEIRSFDYKNQLKAINPSPEVLKKLAEGSANVAIVLEEGLIPKKVGRPFNFGIKGAVDAVKNPAAKKFIATVGTEALTMFAMNKLGMFRSQNTGPGTLIFAHDVTKLAVSEAAIAFELPMIEESPAAERLSLIVLDEQGKFVTSTSLPVISENGDLARVILEEDAVSRYAKTGMRVAVKHVAAIVTAMQVYNKLKANNEFLAQTAAMATYVGASKGIAALEKADTRHWTTLPKTLRMTELRLPPGKYQVAIGPAPFLAGSTNFKALGLIDVNKSGKSLFTLKLPRP